MSANWWTAPLAGSDQPSGRRRSENGWECSHDRPCDEESPKKRPKRGKYVAKACNQCQRRKTKCQGGYPCNSCITKGLECVVRDAEARRSQQSFQAPRGQYKNNVVEALGKIQRQLVQIIGYDRGPVDIRSDTGDAPTSVLGSAQPIAPPNRTSLSESTPKTDADAFSGEPSIVHVLHEIEGHLEKIGMANPFPPSPSPSQPLTPMYDGCQSEGEVNHIQSALDSHGIVPDRDQWDELLNTFSDEVHILYPFLHFPILRSTYEDLWDHLLVNSPANHKDIKDRVKIAQVLFCLATGRCSESTRKDTEEGRHSAGWSLFRAGTDVLGEPLEIFDDFSISLEALQAVMLAVIYLFRIDANNKTEKFLALAVSHSHLLGLHRKRVTDEMPIFEAEMFRRVWWCTYILDRRLAIDTGRPFLVQDVNTDVPVPLELGEAWLSHHRNTHLTSNQLKKEIEIEIRRNITTPLPHIAAMVDYSRVVGKVWEAHYGAFDQQSISTPLTTEYLEFLVSSTVQKEPSRVWSGSSEPFHVQFAGMEWWQIKQKMLMRIRWLFLRLLIRKSSLRMSTLSLEEDDANGMMCMQLCRTIILEFDHIPDKYPKHTFPFIHYVATATMIALGLIIKQPNFTSINVMAVVQAARMLKRFCTQTWVSGRIIRAVTRINQVIALVLDGNADSRFGSSAALGKVRGAPSSDIVPDSPQLPVSRQPTRPNSYSTYLSSDNLENHPSDHESHHYPSSSLAAASLAQNVGRQEQNRGDSQQVHPNITLPIDTAISSSSALENLMMADFDFEEGLSRQNGFNIGWPCLPGCLDSGLPIQYQDTTKDLNAAEHAHLRETLGADSDRARRMPFSAAGPAMCEVEQNNLLASNLSERGQNEWLQSLFEKRF